MAILTDARVPAAVAGGAAFRRAGLADGVPLIDLQAAADAWAAQPATNPEPSAVGLSSAHLAYVIYTSGSTGQAQGGGDRAPQRGAISSAGRPAASVQRRAAVAHAVLDLASTFRPGELFEPLLRGAWLGATRPTWRATPWSLARWLRERGSRLINSVPSAISALLDAEGRCRRRCARCNLAGEALTRALVERLFAQTPGGHGCAICMVRPRPRT